MNWNKYTLLAIVAMLTACQSMSDKGTIARLRNQHVEIDKVVIEGGLDKAMQSYQHFLAETPDASLAPEAIRRLADLKVEKEYGTMTDGVVVEGRTAEKIEAPAIESRTATSEAASPSTHDSIGQDSSNREADVEFEKRATRSQSIPIDPKMENPPPEGTDDLERAGPLEAIVLYQKLLNDYPLYDRNDQVLYQMSRAYEELGRIEDAMAVMERLVKEFPQSRYIDEVQFRRAEYFFTHRKFLDAEEAYATIVDLGVGSYYYDLALYKLGWTFYKQELYEDAQHRFIALLDHKVSIGHDFDQEKDETERKRTEDTFRVISLGFSNLGGADSVVEYFSRYGKRSYEDKLYSNLAEFYFDKRRYADASATYNAFMSRNPFHKESPNYHMRVIEIHAAGGFPSLVLDSKKAFASTYGLTAEYWKFFDPADRTDVLKNLKSNLTDLANHYHAGYQKPRKKEDKPGHFKEALHWYREFLTSFPSDTESAGINFQLADLLLENHNFDDAAVEYEKTAYNYSAHDRASEAGYAAVYSHRKHLETAKKKNSPAIKRDVVRSSMKFVDTFPKHAKASIVLGAAAEDLYAMKDYPPALAAGRRLIAQYPAAGVEITRTAWLIVAHSSYELKTYNEAEVAYVKVLELLPADDKTRPGLVDNLAASIYKQGEQANAVEDYRAAADHFLRVSRMAPTSKIRINAEYDGASALIQLKDWPAAAAVLVAFRKDFPDHELQPDVTKKIAFVYRENEQLSLAAKEYERIETESSDDDIRRDALLVAAELYAKDKDSISALKVYRRYVEYFPKPVGLHLETRNKIALILKKSEDRKAYLKELRKIVAIEAAAGNDQTPRTRYLAGTAALVLAESTYGRFTAIKLVKPFKRNLKKKQKLMKKVTKEFSRLVSYELGEVTAAATYYLAEIYAHFSKALMESERPEGLSPLELEQYELAIEEQAYPFEEKAIEVHENNLKLIAKGIYNSWIDKSLQKLAVFMPARYAKAEESSGIIASPEVYVFAVAKPEPPALPEIEAGKTDMSAAPAATVQDNVEAETDGLDQPEAADPSQETKTESPPDAAGLDETDNPPQKNSGTQQPATAVAQTNQ